jgi:hypothetical protein
MDGVQKKPNEPHTLIVIGVGVLEDCQATLAVLQRLDFGEGWRRSGVKNRGAGRRKSKGGLRAANPTFQKWNKGFRREIRKRKVVQNCVGHPGLRMDGRRAHYVLPSRQNLAEMCFPIVQDEFVGQKRAEIEVETTGTCHYRVSGANRVPQLGAEGPTGRKVLHVVHVNHDEALPQHAADVAASPDVFLELGIIPSVLGAGFTPAIHRTLVTGAEPDVPLPKRGRGVGFLCLNHYRSLHYRLLPTRRRRVT